MAAGSHLLESEGWKVERGVVAWRADLAGKRGGRMGVCGCWGHRRVGCGRLVCGGVVQWLLDVVGQKYIGVMWMGSKPSRVSFLLILSSSLLLSSVSRSGRLRCRPVQLRNIFFSFFLSSFLLLVCLLTFTPDTLLMNRS